MEDLLNKIDKMVEEPFITPNFDDNWKEYAKNHLDMDVIIDIAWKQGRKNILMEDAMEKIIYSNSKYISDNIIKYNNSEIQSLNLMLKIINLGELDSERLILLDDHIKGRLSYLKYDKNKNDEEK